MLFNDTKKHFLVKGLIKEGWVLLQSEEIWLARREYHIRLDQESFTLFCNVKQGTSLVELGTFDYGRRQSQSLKRAVEKHRRETKQCTSSNLKEDQKR
jgi:hypothetical protein